MRKIIAAVFIFLSLFTYSQISNRFSDTEGVDQHSSSSNSVPEPKTERYIDAQAAPCDTTIDCDCDGILDGNEDNPDEICGPPNPADPIPIDNYIPLLVILAAGLITYKTYGRKSLS